MEDRLRQRGVLISASVDVHGQSVTSSGSGFIVKGGGDDNCSSSTLATSANWMKTVLSLRLGDNSVDASSLSRLEWTLTPGTQFFVHLRSPDGDKLAVHAATIVSVCLMRDVFRTLCSLWLDASPAASMTRDSHVDGLLPLLLYPSAVVVLNCALPTVLPSLSAFSMVPPSSLSPAHPLLVVATPFGDYFPKVFLNSLSSGCLGSCHGNGGCVFLTDAHCVHGCEGGLVLDGEMRSTVGAVGMVGMVISCLVGENHQQGLPSGMTLACSMTTVMKTIGSSHQMVPDLTDQHMFSDGPDTTSVSSHFPVGGCVVCVVSGGSWASGVLLTREVVLTCGHVLGVSHADHVTVRWPGDMEPHAARVIYSAPPTSVPDVALLRLNKEAPVRSPTLLKWPAKISSLFTSNACLPVIAMGYCAQNPITSRGVLLPPVVTRGVVSNVVRHGSRLMPVMLQTDAGVHHGMSGGLLCDADGRHALGVLVGCARNDSRQLLVPSIGFALPFTWIGQPLLDFIATGDMSYLQRLSCPEVSSLWKLHDFKMAICSKL